MSLQAPEKVQKLQKTLHAKAKESPEMRFYTLYDKVYRADVLEYAYRCCKANGGAPGVDEEDFAHIEAYGEQKWLGELAEELRTHMPGIGCASGWCASTRLEAGERHIIRMSIFTVLLALFG